MNIRQPKREVKVKKYREHCREEPRQARPLRSRPDSEFDLGHCLQTGSPAVASQSPADGSVH